MDITATSKSTAAGAPADTKPPDAAKDVLDVTVLMGGPSAERAVSLMSGRQIVGGLVDAGHRVTMADISPEDTSALDRPGIDVVFIALHGQFGESGEVQRLCERRGLPYVGSGPRASELAMDKAASKGVFCQAGLHTPDWAVLDAAGLIDGLMPLPVVCKPVDGGSSLDVTIARTDGERDQAVRQLLDRCGRAMIEQFIEGAEVTVGILDGKALPLLRIVVPAGGFYDYQAKYSDDAQTQYIFETGLDADAVAAVQRAAVTAHELLGCRDMSRVDIIIDSTGNPQVLEVNTIPGFTAHSLLPRAAAQAGIEFPQLVDRIARMALARPAGPGE